VLARYADLAWTRQWRVWGYTRVPLSTTGPSRSYTSGLLIFVNWLLLGLIVVAAVVKVIVPLTPQVNLEAEQKSLPYQAVEFIKHNRPPGPMFNSYNWGGYLMFKLWPDYPVYIDGRTDLYNDTFIRRYVDMMVAADGWQNMLAEDGINLVFVERNSTLAKFLRQEPGWEEIYSDDMAAIFERAVHLSPD
jgi:hypothetical protein